MTPAGSRDPPTALRRAAVTAVRWTSASSAAIALLQFLQVAVLAHLLAPEDFGLMAAVTVVLGFAQAFSDLGFTNAIIARERPTREVLSSLYWANILAGLAVFVLVSASSPLVAAFYRDDRLVTLVPVAAISFIIAPLGQQFQALLEKELRFDQVARIEMTAVVIATAVAITAAAQGAGVLALVLATLANTGARALLLARVGWRRWRPILRLRVQDLRGYLGFGLYQMGERSVNFLSANVDYLLVGRFLGTHTLGIYALAYQLALRPLVTLNPVLVRVAFPVFAQRRSDDAALRRGFVEMTRLLASIVTPVLVGLAVTAPVLVPVAFGPGWEDTATLASILALVGLIKALNNPIGTILLAKSRPDIGFKLNVGLLVALTGSLALAVQVGLVAVAWAYVAVVSIVFVISREIVWRLIGLSWRSYLRALSRPIALSAAMGAAMYAGYLAARTEVSEPGILLALSCAIGAITYALLVARYDRPYVTEVYRLLRHRDV